MPIRRAGFYIGSQSVSRRQYRGLGATPWAAIVSSGESFWEGTSRQRGLSTSDDGR